MLKTLAKTFLPALCVSFLLIGCASTEVAPISVGEKPSDDTDEAGLWLQMERAEKDLRTSSIVERDPELNAYVQSVTCRVIGSEYCNDLRVYIVKQPFFNANMAPNGQMQVWTGLLLRAENEAQLAFVIGHEFAHYRLRHSLQQWRELKNAANASMLFSVGVAAAGVPDAAVLGDIAFAARIFGFGRDKEREADREGYDLIARAGYDGAEAAAVWRYLIDETQKSDSKRARKRVARASIFSTHPVTSERIENLSAFHSITPGGKDVRGAEYTNAIEPFLNQWLQDDLVRRDFGQHLYLIAHLLERSELKGILHYRRAEALRLRRQDGDADAALSSYRTAIEYVDAPAAAWRALGDAEKKAGNSDQAIIAYTKYLSLNPDARDANLVASGLSELQAEGN